jgi:hypothetical protein
VRADDAAAVPDAAALTTAMAVAPGVYARNRMFAFFKDPAVRRARDRAALLRGIVRQLTGSQGAAEVLAFTRGERTRLRYRVPAIRLERALDLDAHEAACLAYLVARAGSSLLGPPDSAAAVADRAAVEAALRRLSV